MAINKLILGDCLEVLKTIDSETIDLIYIDPPFFSNRTYEVIWGDKGEIRSFEDRFSGGIDHYISWLKDRIVEMHRILKPTGSIFVHCDDHANSYIRVQILDKVFGSGNFQSELIWKRTSSHNKSKTIGQIHDTIYFYSKTKDFIFNQIKVPYTEKHISEVFSSVDEFGNYKRADLTGSGIRNGASGSNWKNYNPTSKNRHWAIPKNLLAQFKIDSSADIIEILNKLDELGLILHSVSPNALPGYKNYSQLSEGKIQQSVIEDIPPTKGKEAIGYPTQKPMLLLERIVQMASNENDVILDCFAGGGTTIAVADKLNRNWIGIDQSVNAVKVTEFRLNQQQGLFSKPFSVFLHKYDYDTLRYKNAFEFETWIVGQFGGLANSKQRGDLGLDGRTRENQPIQVKRSDNIGRNVIDNFKSACERYDKTVYERNKSEQKPVGFIIAFSFGKGAIQEVARLKNEENVLIKLVTVEEIVPIAKKPTLQVEIKDLGTNKNLREIEFVATGQSEAGIEFYAWDFGYNEQSFLPTVLLDKEGKQTHKFAVGEHKIAVKVVDNEGLESLEVVKLKINGVVQRN